MDETEKSGPNAIDRKIQREQDKRKNISIGKVAKIKKKSHQRVMLCGRIFKNNVFLLKT